MDIQLNVTVYVQMTVICWKCTEFHTVPGTTEQVENVDNQFSLCTDYWIRPVLGSLCDQKMDWVQHLRII